MVTSTEDDDKQKIATGYPPPPSTDTFHHAPPPAPYPIPCGAQGYAPHPYAPTDSYPFPHGYQLDPQKSYTQQHQPYNNNSGYYYYNLQQQQQQQQQPLVFEPNRTTSPFARAMCVLMVTLVSSMCVMTLIMWFLFGSYTPKFEVTSLKVTNFTVTDTALTGLWDVDIAVTNHNKELAMGFDRVMSSLFYKESLLGVETVMPFQVPPKQQTHLNFTMKTEQIPTEPKLPSGVLPMLVQERGGGGVVYFSLRLVMKANFTTPNVAPYKQENVRVFCENLQVEFSESGEGTLSKGLGNPCLLRLNERIDSFQD